MTLVLFSLSSLKVQRDEVHGKPAIKSFNKYHDIALLLVMSVRQFYGYGIWISIMFGLGLGTQKAARPGLQIWG